MIILKSHFKICESRHILLQIREQDYDATLPMETNSHEHLYKSELNTKSNCMVHTAFQLI